MFRLRPFLECCCSICLIIHQWNRLTHKCILFSVFCYNQFSHVTICGFSNRTKKVDVKRFNYKIFHLSPSVILCCCWPASSLLPDLSATPTSQHPPAGSDLIMTQNLYVNTFCGEWWGCSLNTNLWLWFPAKKLLRELSVWTFMLARWIYNNTSYFVRSLYVWSVNVLWGQRMF